MNLFRKMAKSEAFSVEVDSNLRKKMGGKQIFFSTHQRILDSEKTSRTGVKMDDRGTGTKYVAPRGRPTIPKDPINFKS
jgi:hypothetical protein